MSTTLSELRDRGYIKSAIHPNNRRLRVHRIVYDEADKNWDRDTFPAGKVSKRTFPPGKPILSQIEGKIDTSNSVHEDLGRGTYVLEHIKDINGEDQGTDCAEAHDRTEKYLRHCEALLTSADRDIRDTLKHERPRLEQIADDACLPERVNERAAKLLAQIRT